MKPLRDLLDKLHPHFTEGGRLERLYPLYEAIDTFTYTVTDGNGGTDTATVSVTVTGANDGPTATPDSATVGEDDAAPTTIDLPTRPVRPCAR